MASDELIERAVRVIKPLFDAYCVDLDAEDHAWEAAQAAFDVFEQAQAETEWEYGAHHSQGTNAHPTRARAEDAVAWHLRGDERRRPEFRGLAYLVRRRKAGPWEPVGATDD